MAKKRESAEVRLRKAIEARNHPDYLRRRKNYTVGITGKPPDLDKPEVWAVHARSALTLRPVDKVIKKAFEAFHLDPGDPRNWRELLNELAEVLGPAPLVERKRAGRKLKWPLKRRQELAKAVYRITQHSAKKIKDLQACTELAKAEDSPRYFRETKPGALVRQLVKGRTQLIRRLSRSGQELPPYLVGRKKREI